MTERPTSSHTELNGLSGGTRHPFNIPNDLETIFGDETGLAGNFVMEMLGMLRQVVMGSSVEDGGVNAGRGPRPRRRAPGGGSEPTRTEFLSVLHAARAALYGDGNDDDDIRAVILPEAMAPPNSTLHRDSGDNGSGSIEFDTVVAEDMDPELLRDTESSVPPLEPINIPRQETPSLPSEPIHTESAAQDDDEMPALQSVSDSSDSEGDHGGSDDDERDGHFRYDSSDDLPPLERVIQPDEEVSPFSRRFSTVVERDRDCETLDEQPGASSASPSVVQDLEGCETSQDVPQPGPMLEPPFVTDGRGRVVWSNKDSTETIASPETREETREDAQSPSSAARLFEWMTGFF
ncbi:hypothetical protein C0993_009758 [Termitomyces sp. T159_Od127]|nr:hypothetical protein C0993_009758 [Termitomyces sp. T159_Od127]